MNSVYKKIYKKIKEYDEIVIARHIGPDPDAIASQIALKCIIEKNFPNKKVYAVGTSVNRFKYLGSMDKIDFDTLNKPLLIITDVPKFDRVDGINKEIFDYTIKIDHHPCDEVVCDLEIVDESSSSACQMVLEFIYKNRIKIDSDIAAIIYAGIISDSDRFLLSYTSSDTFMLVGKLLRDYPFDITEVYKNIYDRPINERRFESYILENIEITPNGFGHINIPIDVIKKYQVDNSTPSNLVNDLNFIKELKVWAFASFDEKLNLYKINIRSRDIVINDVAERFNGGGHKFASGARIKTKEDVYKLFEALDERCMEENINNHN